VATSERSPSAWLTEVSSSLRPKSSGSLHSKPSTAYSGPNGYSKTWTARIGPSVALPAQRSAAREASDPSTPTTTGASDESAADSGTTATGQGAVAATFRL